MLSFILPKITVTPASDDLVSSKFDHPSAAPAHARRHSVITLTLPPLAQAHDDRMSVAQSGLRLGSFRLNCAESVAVAVNLPGLNADNSSPKANLASTKRVFNWGSSNGLQESQKSTHTAGRHSRAKSLNSLADFTLPAHVKAPTELGSSRRSKYRSGSSVFDIGRNGHGTIDLSILDSPSMQSSISDSTLFTSPKRDAFGFSFSRSR